VQALLKTEDPLSKLASERFMASIAHDSFTRRCSRRQPSRVLRPDLAEADVSVGHHCSHQLQCNVASTPKRARTSYAPKRT
jgi:hypothetical protein